MFDVPSNENVTKVVITAQTINEETEPVPTQKAI